VSHDNEPKHCDKCGQEVEYLDIPHFLRKQQEPIKEVTFSMADEHQSACEIAERLTNGQRREDYGHPLDDFSKAAAMTAPIREAMARGDIHPALGHALCMVQVKIARLLNTPDHRDSVIDGAGYFNTYDMILKKLAE